MPIIMCLHLHTDTPLTLTLYSGGGLNPQAMALKSYQLSQ